MRGPVPPAQVWSQSGQRLQFCRLSGGKQGYDGLIEFRIPVNWIPDKKKPAKNTDFNFNSH